ncbi:MAG TPA: pilus assembly protein N-terminal domain-containing protein, partial [Vineibacter sp.]|nr:pilus assembly protein N-terminal domain-containing protein [Vineibacter sp.]
DLTRQYNERMQAQARADDEARRARGFFGRVFGSSPREERPSADQPTVSSAPIADTTASGAPPAPEPKVARVAPASAPNDQVAQAQPPAPPSGPVTTVPGAPDQLAQTPPPAPGQRPPVPVPPPGQPTLITPPPGATPPSSGPVAEANPRQFGRGSVVPTEQPTLQIDSGKGTIMKLRSPASTVFIANPEIADVQVKTGGTIYVFGKKPGETVLYAVDEQDRVLLNTVVIVGHPTGRVLGAVAGMPGGSTIQATTVGGAVVLQGRSDNPAAIEQARRVAVGVTGDPSKVINQVGLDGANQVLLRVRIVEAQREALKRVGFNWETVLDLPGRLVGGLATPSPISGVNPIVPPFPPVAGFGYPRINSPVGGAVVGRFTKGATDIFSLIDLLATENMLTVLAEPNLTAMSGETASFLAGGEFPIIVPGGNNAFTVQFKQFGVSLAFTPTIHGNGRISIRAKPEVSQLSTNGQVNFQGFVIPALTVRRADTTVELASGQSFAIAGLIQHNSTQDISKLPGLGDVPILGALFKSDSFRRQQSELVIIVTPYLVRPSNNKNMATPLDGWVPPTDADRYLYGRTQHPTGGRRPSTTRVSSSSSAGGFVLE